MRKFSDLLNENLEIEDDLEMAISQDDFEGELNFDEKLPGGLADNMTLEDLAMRHNVDLEDIEIQFEKGVKVEMEHTDDSSIAEEIAKDHIFEDPNYYDKLETIEDNHELDDENFTDLDDDMND